MPKPKPPSLTSAVQKHTVLRFLSPGIKALSLSIPGDDKPNSFFVSELILETIVDLTEPQARGETQDFMKAVDDSSFSLIDWLEGLEVLLAWLKENRMRATIADARAYLSCAAESQASSGISLPLKVLVRNFLADSGFERGQKLPS